MEAVRDLREEVHTLRESAACGCKAEPGAQSFMQNKEWKITWKLEGVYRVYIGMIGYIYIYIYRGVVGFI